jgi:hypothetical protein
MSTISVGATIVHNGIEIRDPPQCEIVYVPPTFHYIWMLFWNACNRNLKNAIKA